MSHIFSRMDLSWREQADGSHALHVVGRKGAILHVVRDVKRAGMWRVRHLNGRLSDMVNISRAKDAGTAHGMAILNQREAA